MTSRDRAGGDIGLESAGLSDQLAAAILAALDQAGMTQAELARAMGVSAKHMNHLVHGKSGANGMFDYAAFVLGKRWSVRLVNR